MGLPPAAAAAAARRRSGRLTPDAHKAIDGGRDEGHRSPMQGVGQKKRRRSAAARAKPEGALKPCY